MKKRYVATISLVVLLLLVLAGIKLTQKHREEKAAREEKQKRIFTFEKDKVKAMILEEGGKEAVLVKKGDNWYLDEPVKSLADDLRAKNLLNLSELRYVTKIETPKKLEDYGFGKNEEKITFVTESEKEHTLIAGGERPVGGGCFVKVEGENPIYAVTDDVKVTITARVRDLFERDVMPLYPADLSGISVMVEGKKFELKKKNGSWYLGDEAVDREAVDDFVREICFLNANDLYSGKKPEKVKVWTSFRSDKEKKTVDVRIFEPAKGEKDACVQTGDRVELLMIRSKRYEELVEKYDKLAAALKEAERKREEEKSKSEIKGTEAEGKVKE